MKRSLPLPALGTLVVLAVAFAALAARPLPVSAAATINVTTTTDEFDLVPNGSCSLREAIQSSNINADFGGCVNTGGAYGANDLINVPTGDYFLTGSAGDNTNATGDLDILDSVVIQGAGQGSTIIDANGVDRVFDIVAGGGAVFNDLTITDGFTAGNGGGVYSTLVALNLVLDSVTVRENTAVGSGGGIYTDGGTVEIANSLIERNFAAGNTLSVGVGGGGIFGALTDIDIDDSVIRLNRTTTGGSMNISLPGSGGGGIYVWGSSLDISGSDIVDNTVDAFLLTQVQNAGLGGGGIYSVNSQIDIETTTINDNEVLTGGLRLAEIGEGGGGIYAVSEDLVGALQLEPTDCTVCIMDSWIDGNLAENSDGGGLYIGFGESLSLLRSTVSNNHATAPPEDNSGYGGGLYLGGTGEIPVLDEATAYIENVTFSGNVADDAGGAMYLGDESEIELRFVTISDNQAPEGGAIATVATALGETFLTFFATVVGNNETLGGNPVENCHYDGLTTVTSLGYSIEDQDTCELDHATDEVNRDLLLLPLGFNGGLAPTHALQLESPAVDFVEQGCPPPPTDERGVERPQDGDEDGTALCDAGAYELLGEVFDLAITKLCPNAEGDGDADFNILVTQLEDTLAADALDCNEVMVVGNLPDGLYTIRELITGPDANNFTTAIVCVNEDGQTVTPGRLANVQLTSDTACEVINVLQAGAGGEPGSGLPPGSIIVPIDLNNTNTNTLNNDNLNTNNNENTNTQEQSNFQEQINDNNQVTTVNSGPTVNIDFD